MQPALQGYLTFLNANVLQAAGSLYAARQRTLLALFCIVIGIGSVIAMITVGEIVRAESAAEFKDLGTDVLTIRKRRDPSDGVQTFITLDDVTNLPVQSPTITAATPWVDKFGEFSYAGQSIGRGRIYGVSEGYADLNKLTVAEGRMISDFDLGRDYCVVGDDIVAAMRAAGARRAVGEWIKASGITCTVVGTLRPTPSRGGTRVNEAVFIPITTAMRVFDRGEITDIIARMRPDVHYTVVERDVVAYFRSRSAHMSVTVETARELIEQIHTQLQFITLLLVAAGSIALLVGGASVMNVMLTSIAERRKEIGIRRALGARRRDIQAQFLTESVMLSLFGGVLGTVLGIGGSFALCRFNEWVFFPSMTAVTLGVGMAFGVGVFFGFYPAYQAARLDPIAAMRG